MKYHIGSEKINGKICRKCRKCRETKELNEVNFIKRNTENGWRGNCRICFNKEARVKQEMSKLELAVCKRYRINAMKTKPLQCLLRTAKGNSKKYWNREFNINLQDLENLWEIQKGLCFYTNKPMLFELGNENSVSIDRINSNIGYVKDNIVLCKKQVNIMKNDATIDQLIEFSQDIINNKINILSGVLYKIPMNIPMPF
jgi:hypothetical protein